MQLVQMRSIVVGPSLIANPAVASDHGVPWHSNRLRIAGLLSAMGKWCRLSWLGTPRIMADSNACSLNEWIHVIGDMSLRCFGMMLASMAV
jgi:hypothetical protein